MPLCLTTRLFPSTAAAGVILVAAVASASAADAVVCRFSGKDGAPRTEAEITVALLHQNSDAFRLFDANYDGRLDAAEADALAVAEREKLAPALAALRQRAAAGKPMLVSASGETPVPIIGTTEPEKGVNQPGMAVFLRKDLGDVKLFRSPQKALDAIGAAFSVTRNGETDNTAWNAQGVAGAIFAYYSDTPTADGPYFAGIAFAPSLAFHRLTNSSAHRRQDIDILTPAFTTEAAFDDTLGGLQLLRGRASYTTSFSGEGGFWSATAEWQPIWIDRLPFDIGSSNGLGPLTWELSPVFKLRYDQKTDGDDLPIFAERDEALRYGVTVSAAIKPKQSSELVPRYLQAAHLTGSYTYLADALSSRSYQGWSVGLGYNIDPEGHTALTFSHSAGRDAETGVATDVTSLGLSVKF